MELTLPPMRNPPSGWVCQKCGRSYGPMMPECAPCNSAVAAQQASHGRRRIVAP